MKTLTPEQLREKYLNLAKTKGYDAAITALAQEIGNKEPHVFDNGFNSEKLSQLQNLRTISRELYTLKLTEESKSYYKG